MISKLKKKKQDGLLTKNTKKNKKNFKNNNTNEKQRKKLDISERGGVRTSGLGVVEFNDGRKVDEEAISFIRGRWIQGQMKGREDEFTEYKRCNIFTGSYNVNGKKMYKKNKNEDDPNNQTNQQSEKNALDPQLVEELKVWLNIREGMSNDEKHDVYAIGFQEIVDLNAVNVTMDGKSQQRSQLWQDLLLTALNSYSNDYVLLYRRHLVGILLCIFVKREHADCVHALQVCNVGVGVMGVMGNKGGVSIRFRFYDSTVCFICTHLAAHRDNIEGRNSDFHNILSKTLFKEKVLPFYLTNDLSITDLSLIQNDNINNTLENEVEKTDEKEWKDDIDDSEYQILDHDYIWWIGDLNYRIIEEVAVDSCHSYISDNNIEYLLSKDQLILEMKKGTVFRNFLEGEINFPPTYKFQPGTDIYERRPEKKLRAPAWCDRILWTSPHSINRIRQLNYTSCPEIKISDHKPVSSVFDVDIKLVIQERRTVVYRDIMRTLDRHENNAIPRVEISDNCQPNFGTDGIKFNIPSTATIEVKNIGSVIAHFHFAPKLEEDDICKKWLKIEPSFGMLLPNESITIKFTINVDTKTAFALSEGDEILDDILIFRLEKGRDFFLTISANYARSAFAMSLEELVQFACPIRELPLPTSKNYPLIQSKRSVSPLGVPKELWRMVDYLFQNGVDEKNIFLTPGQEDEMIIIRECLDQSTQFPSNLSPHSFAATLLQFLQSLPLPLIPTKLLPLVEIDTHNIRSWSRRFLEHLPPVYYNVFVYLISFFREVVLHGHLNRLSSHKIAMICCNSFISNEILLSEDNKIVQKRHGMQLVIHHFLTTETI